VIRRWRLKRLLRCLKLKLAFRALGAHLAVLREAA